MKFRFQGTKGRLERGRVYNLKLYTTRVEDTRQRYGAVVASFRTKPSYRELLVAETIGHDKDLRWRHEYRSLEDFNKDWRDV